MHSLCHCKLPADMHGMQTHEWQHQSQGFGDAQYLFLADMDTIAFFLFMPLISYSSPSIRLQCSQVLFGA